MKGNDTNLNVKQSNDQPKDQPQPSKNSDDTNKPSGNGNLVQASLCKGMGLFFMWVTSDPNYGHASESVCNGVAYLVKKQ